MTISSLDEGIINLLNDWLKFGHRSSSKYEGFKYLAIFDQKDIISRISKISSVEKVKPASFAEALFHDTHDSHRKRNGTPCLKTCRVFPNI